jgi:hypothetical protein
MFTIQPLYSLLREVAKSQQYYEVQRYVCKFIEMQQGKDLRLVPFFRNCS